MGEIQMTPLDFRKVGPGTCWNELRSENLLAVPNLIEKVHAAADELESLRQQNAELTAQRDEAVSAVQRLSEGQPFNEVVIADTVKRMTAEIVAQRDAAMKDAERYRWLRNSDYNTYPAVFKACQAWNTLRRKTLDEAIDAAIANCKGQK